MDAFAKQFVDKDDQPPAIKVHVRDALASVGKITLQSGFAKLVRQSQTKP
jgi:hypothetical protein